jgi:putative phosphoesterase
VLVVCSDTHGTEDPRLTGRTREAVATAEEVIHAGDFTTPAVLDAFHATANRLHAVHGNADVPALRDRLPTARVVEYAGVRFAVTHRRRGGETALSMFGRERGADVVVSGHTHDPGVREGTPTLLNPGSHADPRGNRPGHAELVPSGGGLDGRIRQPDGTTVEEFRIEDGSA